MDGLISQIETACDNYQENTFTQPSVLLINPLDYENVIKNSTIFSGIKVYPTEKIMQGDFKLFG